MISYRPVLSFIVAVAAIFVTLRLSYVEIAAGKDGPSLPPTEARAKTMTKVRDLLLDIRYIEEDREANLKLFGLPDNMIRDAMERMKDYDRNSRLRIDQLIDGAPSIDQLHQAFCSRSSGRRPRYEAMVFLVDEKNGDRRTIDLQATSALEVQDWATTAPINRVYTTLELSESRERPPDATLMGVAAILLGAEDHVLQGDRPWGRGGRVWSWDEVLQNSRWRTADRRVVEYFSLMHVFAESMWREGGICSVQ